MGTDAHTTADGQTSCRQNDHQHYIVDTPPNMMKRRCHCIGESANMAVLQTFAVALVCFAAAAAAQPSAELDVVSRMDRQLFSLVSRSEWLIMLSATDLDQK